MLEFTKINSDELELDTDGDDIECVAESMDDIECVADASDDADDFDELDELDELDDLDDLEDLDNLEDVEDLDGVDDESMDTFGDDIEENGIEKFYDIAEDDDHAISFRGLLNSDMENTQIKGYTPAECRKTTGTQNYCPFAGSGR